jgi:hypothetical protein
MGGADPTITIPSVRITLPDADDIKDNLPGVNLRLALDESVLAGTDRIRGLMMLAALNPVILGSSISHFDSVAFPNQLMEPAINPDLTSSVDTPQDLTTKQLTDIGWFSDKDGVPDGVDKCIGSDLRTTINIESCDSGVPNVVLTDGCSLSDVLSRCSREGNHGSYASCVAVTSSTFNRSGLITADGHGRIQSCATRVRP